MKKIMFLFCALATGTVLASDTSEIKTALERAVDYFYSTNVHGGYVYFVTPDLSERWGESPTDEHTIEVQPPGTPAVGQSFLRVYELTQDETALKAAKDAAFALIRGQNDLGGWEHTIRFNRPKGNRVGFDDNQTQSAIRFLMNLDRVMEHDSLSAAIEKALDMMLTTQLDNGGWPHRYPLNYDYHDFATFNDGGINDCLNVMLDAYSYYKKDEYRISILRAGWFLIISQLPPPQPGWAQQYNQYLQPSWARAFEPPSVCPLVTVRNINTLMDLYLYTGDGRYLEPIPDALTWLDDTQLPNGKWPRFVEIGTGEALYYDRGRIRVNSLEELHIERSSGYGYETDLTDALASTRQRFDKVHHMGFKNYVAEQNRPLSKEEIQARLDRLRTHVKSVLNELDKQGRWITKKDRYKQHTPGRRWNGEYKVQDRISSHVFNTNINILCDYLELWQQLE